MRSDRPSSPLYPRLRRWRYRVAVRIYPWWTQDGVDAVRWRAHQKRRELGFVICTEVRDPADKGSES